MLAALTLSLPLALAAASVPDEAAWRERLFAPPIALDELAVLRFFPEDLERSAREDPAQRVRALSERVQAGDADPRLRLELAEALVAAERREEAHALFAELGAELGERIELEEGNWKLAGLYGEVLAAYGDAFQSLRTLEDGADVLRRVLEAEPRTWRAAEALCGVHLRQAIALRAAGDEAAADRELELARSCGARAVEAAPGEFQAHRTRFLARWAQSSTGTTLGAALEVLGDLRRAAELAPEPEWTAAVADGLESSLLVGAVEPALRPEDAFAALPEVLRARPAQLEAGLQRLALHPELGEAAWRLRWLLAFYGARSDEALIFERALARARSPELLLEGRLALLARRGTTEELAALAARLVAVRPDARTENLLANVDLERGALDLAIAHYRRALELDGEGIHARAGLAIALLRQGADPAGPRALLEPLVSAGEPPLSALFALGTALALEGERERALELVDLALSGAPLELPPPVQATRDELRAD